MFFRMTSITTEPSPNGHTVALFEGLVVPLDGAAALKRSMRKGAPRVRPGGRVTFFAAPKKVTNERRLNASHLSQTLRAEMIIPCGRLTFAHHAAGTGVLKFHRQSTG